MTAATEITTRVLQIPLGKPFLVKSLVDHGNREVVTQVLEHLHHEGILTRITSGIYVRPKVSKRLGRPVLPSAFEIVAAIAEAENAKVQVHGSEAARKLRLSTQVPTQGAFVTDGPTYQFKLGKLMVTMENVPSETLILAGRPAGLAHAAFLHLGPKEVTSGVLRQVEKEIGESEFSAIRDARDVLPRWLSMKIDSISIRD